MPLNLITDQWIPVVDTSGNRRIIAPWEIADKTLLRPDWPRADLNIACLELLIGLVFMADPPASLDDWDMRSSPDPERLREKLAPFAPAFNLIGEGPLFLQDLEQLEGADPTPIEKLFVDAASGNAEKFNKDILVHRNRYRELDLPLAAMALFAAQSFAYYDSSSHRPSLKGHGALVTFIDPVKGLWSLVWANTPKGNPAEIHDLPWMKKVRNGTVSFRANEGWPIEVFFSMSWRIRLTEKDGVITSFKRARHGNLYENWLHPLVPYRRKKPAEPWKSIKVGPGFSYRNWPGVSLPEIKTDRLLPEVVGRWEETQRSANLIVGGWFMSKATAADFIFAEVPIVALPEDIWERPEDLVISAREASKAFQMAIATCHIVMKRHAENGKYGVGKAEYKPAKQKDIDESNAIKEQVEGFFLDTEPKFLQALNRLKQGEAFELVSESWIQVLREAALMRFDKIALPLIDQRNAMAIEKIVSARWLLTQTFMGWGKFGTALFRALGKEPIRKKEKQHE